jgi:methionyl-tRNA synthetase
MKKCMTCFELQERLDAVAELVEEGQKYLDKDAAWRLREVLNDIEEILEEEDEEV